MSLLEVSLRTGVPIADIESLMRGNVPASVAERLGVPLLGLEDLLLRGYAGAQVAHRLGMSMSAAEELAQTMGRYGLVGIILGLLLAGVDGASRHAKVGGR